MKGINIICGNNIEVLKTLADNSVDSVVTDPPYGLGKEPDANEMLKAWLESGYMEVSGKGFMGKEWDSFVPQPIFWKEVFRVLKPGGHILSFFGTRTYDWGVMAIRLAGFEIRDSLQWVYGSGFPKSYNVAKGIEGKLTVGSSNTKEYKLMQGEKGISGIGTFNKMEKEQGAKPNDCTGRETTINHILTTDEAKQWDGWGSALKPAVEPIVLARKPLEKGLNIAENVLKWGTGAINIDGCRVGNDLIKSQKAGQGFNNVKGFGVNTKLGNEEAKEYISEDRNGRFPANLILTHHEDCECVGTKKVKGQIDKPTNRTQFEGTWSMDNTGLRSYTNKSKEGYGDENGEETIEDWNCVDDCPIKIMDEQSGVSKSTGGRIGNKNGAYSGIGANGFTTNHEKGDAGFGDKGGASRFFYTPKTSKSERNWGLEDFEETISSDRKAIHNVGANNPRNRSGKPKANIHPTVKPVKLMQYLARLITPPNGLVLDPFNGSGTTGIACKLEGFDYIGLEISEEYCEISRSRIESWDDELEYMMELRIKEIEREQKKDVSQLNLF